MRFFLLALSLPAFGGSVEGIHNFYKVDEHVYRGAQPTDEGFQYLAKIGVKTVIDRFSHSAENASRKLECPV